MPLAEARKSGAMMLFGEKYPDVVRDGLDRRFQQGALRRHAPGQQPRRSGLLKIVGEESVAAGTRRITALTGRGGAGAASAASRPRSAGRPALLRVPPDEVPERVEALAKELRQLRRSRRPPDRRRGRRRRSAAWPPPPKSAA